MNSSNRSPACPACTLALSMAHPPWASMETIIRLLRSYQLPSNVATPNLTLNWRFATNRNAMDGSDNNCINNTDQNCKHKVYSDSPYGYFCDDLLGMWIITYFWFTVPPNTTNATCATVFHNIGAKNGFNSEGYPVILTAHELNDELEAKGCGAEGQENPAGTDGGAAWLVCPAIPDPRNGGIGPTELLRIPQVLMIDRTGMIRAQTPASSAISHWKTRVTCVLFLSKCWAALQQQG
jgi:hypothetical protein